jgi:uncharacterized protein
VSAALALLLVLSLAAYHAWLYHSLNRQLEHALTDRDHARVRSLIREGANVDTWSWAGGTALFSAAAAGDLEFARELLDRGADVNAATKIGLTPVNAAIGMNSSVLPLLLDRGANPNSTDHHGITPLMWAASCRRIGAVSVLLKAGATVNVRDYSGKSALSYAADGGDPLVVRLIKSAGGRR